MIKQVLCCILLLSGISVCQAGVVKIYAAASLTNVITDIAKQYQIQHKGTAIIPVFAGSSMLAKQIEYGAQSDIFFSADQDWMNYLAKKNKINLSQAIPLLSNRLVLISPKNNSFHIKMDAKFAVAKSFNGYLCTGQMTSVPVGRYAKQSLMALGWLPQLQRRIVETDDVRSALAFVERGECQLGIVYQTDAMLSSKVKVMGVFPSSSHHPIIYPVALTKQGQSNLEAKQFMRYLEKSAYAKMAFQKYGFQLKPR